MTELTLQVMEMMTPLKLSTKIQIHLRMEEIHWRNYLSKCYLIVSGTENAKIKLDDFTITNSKTEKLRGIIFDDKLKFQYHIENFCRKTSSKLSALSRVTPFVNPPQKIYSMTFFSHSLATALWFRSAIAEHSLTK